MRDKQILQALPHEAGEIDSEPVKSDTDDRLQQLQQLFLENYSNIRDQIFAEDHEIWIEDADSIMSRLAEALPNAGIESDREDFLSWARGFVRREAEKYVFMVSLGLDFPIEDSRPASRNRKAIIGAIKQTLRETGIKDAAVSVTDIYEEICAYLFHKKTEEFMKPGTAQIHTRLAKLARRHTLYHISKRRDRHRIIREGISKLRANLPEVFSDAELADMRAMEQEYEAA
jgi:hypothetical protein